jgi:WD40 repeat protein
MRSFWFFVCFILICITGYAQHPRLVIPVGHTEAITDCSFSPNGKLVVTSSFDETACIWNAETGQLLHQLKGHKGKVRSAAFSANGNLVLTSSDDLTVRIWDAISGDSLFLFNTNNRLKSNCFAFFSTSGDSIVMSQSDSLLQVCDVKTGSVLQVLHGNRLHIEGASFSPDGTKIIGRSKVTARIWDVATGKMLAPAIKINATEGFQWIRFSADGSKVLSCLNVEDLLIWDAQTGKSLPSFADRIAADKFGPFTPDGKQVVATLKNNSTQLINVDNGSVAVTLEKTPYTGKLTFSPDGKWLAAASANGKAIVWNALSGKILTSDSIFSSYYGKMCFSPNGSSLLTTDEREIVIHDLKDGHEPILFKGHAGAVDDVLFSEDGKTIYAYSVQRGIEEWETATAKPIKTLLKNIHYKYGRELVYLPDGKRAISYKNGPACIIDVQNGTTLLSFNANTDSINKLFISRDGNLAVSCSDDGKASIWDLATGNLLNIFDLPFSNLETGVFSPDNKFLITVEQGGTKQALVWNLSTKEISDTLGGDVHLIKSVVFSNTGNKVAIGNNNGLISVWDAEKGERLWEKQFNRFNNYEFLVFSPDDQWILAASKGQGVLQLINAGTGAKEWEMNSIRPWFMEPSAFSNDGKQFFTFSFNNTFCKRDLLSGKVLDSLELGTYSLSDYNYASNKLVARNNSEIKLFSLDSNKHLYSLYAIDGADYLVIDSKGRYDGTRDARKLLYLVCNQEVIGLDQLKDQLWVPNLATRIMNGELINDKSLDDLNICNNVPVIMLKESATEYQFVITPQRGGLGDIIVSINGMETQTLQKEDLTQDGSNYVYTVSADFVNSIEGDQKEVKVRALTADNKISSSDVVLKKGSATVTNVIPDLYAVFIGVSNYKGDKLDLQYAAKDARDLGHAFEAAAKKFLNTEPDTEHVFMYRLNTDTPHTGFPDKATIHQTLIEIGTKSKPNDILVIFFAGHGVMIGEKQQFYFLTADASDSSNASAIEETGISMDTLTEWVRPSRIKAQNRVLIFDACNSGQAITNFLTVGSDVESKQIKTIEELNERSKFFILSASASNQSAYEYGMYSQGLLTYSLLNTIKLNQAIFNKRNYLDVSKWFTASNELLTELVKQNKVRQDPQLVSSNTFNVGVVDEDVRNQIQLPEGKPMFGRSEFRNTELRLDNLKLRDAVYDAFNAVITSNATTNILFNETYEGVGVTSLSCDYTVSNGKVTVSVLLIKDGKTRVGEFTGEGIDADLKKLGADIVAKATEFLLKK